MAPAVATALSIGAATTFAGGITPLAVVFALVAVLFTAYSMGELARHLPSAGGMYTYVARGLGSFSGWLMAWAFCSPSPSCRPPCSRPSGSSARLHHDHHRLPNELLWLPLAVLCGLIVWCLIYRGITISTRVGVVLGLIEIGIFLLVSLLLIVNAGARNTHLGLHPRRRGPAAGTSGHGLLPARVRRLRGGRAAGRGDSGTQADDPPGGHLRRRS